MQKNSFVLQNRLNNIVAKLSDKQAGLLFKSILNYAENGTVANFEDNAVGIAFEFVKQDIDYTTSKYAEICEKRKEAIQKRWENTKDTNVFKSKTCNTNAYKAIHNDNDNDVDNELVDKSTNKEKESKEKENSNKRFVKPTVEEIKAYCEQRKNGIDAQKFFDFYESKGWKVGNTPMKNWQAAIRTWEQRGGQKDVGIDYNGKDADLGKYANFCGKKY